MNNKHITPISFSEIFRKLRPYLLVFFLSLLALEGFIFFFASGFGHLVPGSLHPVLNFFNAFAGVSFCFYLKHTKSFKSLSEDFCVLLSVSYGICAYGLLQETNLRYLAIFVLFPLLFYTYEKMMAENRLLSYILLLTLCFFTDYMLTAIILITLTVHVLLFTEGGIGVHLRAFLKFAGLSCIALLISGIFTFPQYAEYFSYIGNDPYTGFSTTLPTITALSRFLLGSVSSAAFFSGMRMDLYFGLFFFMMAVFYFLLSDVSGKEKWKNFIFIFFLFAAAQFSPVYFLVNFFRLYSGGSIYYGFLLIFFLLLLASKVLARIDAFRFASLLKLSLFSLLYLVVCLFCAGHNYHTLATQSNIFFIIAYIVLLLALSFKNKISFPVRPLLICLIALELFCNIFIVTNQNFIPAPLELADHYPDLSSLQVYPALNPSETSAPVTDAESDFVEEIQTAPSQEGISGDISNHLSEEVALENSEAYRYIDTDLIQLLNLLPTEEILTDADRDAAGITALSDYFTIQNAVVRKLGADEDLFTPADFTLSFAKSDDYRVVDLGNHIYGFSYAHDTLHPSTRYYDMAASVSTGKEGTLLVLDTLNLQLYRFDMAGDQKEQNISFYLPLSPEYTVNDHLNGYWLNNELLNKLPALAEAYETLQLSRGGISMLPQYLGIGATCIGIFLMLLLFFNRDKEKIFTALRSLGKRLENSRILTGTGNYFRENRIYWFSFLIPCVFFLLALILNSCMPFGSNSIFDEDGLYLTYPSNLDVYYNLKEGHALYSFLGGYGYSLYAVNPLALIRLFTTFLSPGQIASFLTLEEGFFLGLSGLTLAFYLTHRLMGERADKHDHKILIPVMIYTLNNYMLCMHGFTSWYQIFAALPLVLLAMDYLILHKKCIPYIIALAYCIYSNLYLALYICIFLVIRFFIYHFEDFKDFLFKGLRFAGCSILAALNSFFIISNTLLATWDSAYQIDDSTFPTPGLHGNFFSQWKQHMIFSEVGAVNWNENYVCLYAGIGSFLLLLVFCLSKKIKRSDKLRTLLPVAVLYLSFNGKLISFIWNGFHYQTGVPNRYAFLFMILIALLAYDSMNVLKDLSFSRLGMIGSILIGFFICCQFIGSGNSTLAFMATLVVALFYLSAFAIHFLRSKRQFILRTFTAILAIELFCNMLFAFRQYNLPGIYKTGDVEMIQKAFEELDDNSIPLSRTLYAATPSKNGGAFYQTESNELFNSFVTMHQSNLNMRYGMTAGTNYITTANAGTPLSLSLSGTRFLFCSYFTENPCPDLNEYRYLGSVDDNYIFENPYVLPLGIYAPEELTKLNDYSNFVPYFLEDLSSFYLSDDKSPFSHQLIAYDETASGENIFYYTDENDKILTFDEVNALLEEANKGGNHLTPMDTLYINISVTPEESGPLYLYAIEFVPLGYVKSKEDFQCRISFPTASLPASNDFYNLTVFHSDVMPEFYENANKNTWENLTYTGHTLTGTTDYEEDGYTMLSIPYDRGWKAYIDGKEVDIEDPYQSMMFVKTPAGHHELKLVFIPYGMIQSLFVTGGSIAFTCLLFFIISRLKRKQPVSITK